MNGIEKIADTICRTKDKLDQQGNISNSFKTTLI